MVGLFSAAMVLNVRLSGRTQGLERQNATLTAQVALSADESQLMEDRLNQLQLTSYWLANPANQPLALKPTRPGESSKVMLLLAKDGSGAIIMVSNMKDRSPTSTHQVWLMRQGDRVWAAEVKDDARGMGFHGILAKGIAFPLRQDRISLRSRLRSGCHLCRYGSGGDYS